MGACFRIAPFIAMGKDLGRYIKRKFYMTSPDIRWIQRFNNFSKALAQLEKFIEKGELNELEKQGLIQSFEYTYEIACNTIKDYF